MTQEPRSGQPEPEGMPEPQAEAEQSEATTDSTDQPEAEPAAPPHAEPRVHVPTLLLPRDGIELLERQWTRMEPFPEWRDAFAGLGLTVAWDPEGFDYLTALTGAPADEVIAARLWWLEAQLAADALRLGKALRPSVLLVPAGRRWYVVRTTARSVLVIDGPGHPSPSTALRAARLRYRATLEAEAREVPGEPPEGPEGRAEPAEPSPEGGTGDAASGATA